MTLINEPSDNDQFVLNSYYLNGNFELRVSETVKQSSTARVTVILLHEERDIEEDHIAPKRSDIWGFSGSAGGDIASAGKRNETKGLREAKYRISVTPFVPHTISRYRCGNVFVLRRVKGPVFRPPRTRATIQACSGGLL